MARSVARRESRQRGRDRELAAAVREPHDGRGDARSTALAAVPGRGRRRVPHRVLRSRGPGAWSPGRHAALPPAAIVAVLVVVPTIASLVLRETGKPYTYIHD